MQKKLYIKKKMLDMIGKYKKKNIYLQKKGKKLLISKINIII